MLAVRRLCCGRGQQQPDLRLPADSAATATSSSVAAEQPRASCEPAADASMRTHCPGRWMAAPSPDEETMRQPAKPARETKPDGRYQIRAVLHAASRSCHIYDFDILTDDSREARDFIRRIRSEAAQKLQAATEADETLQMIVSCSL